MISIVRSVHIAWAPAEVYTFVCNYRNDPLWRQGVSAMRQQPEGPATVGTRTEEHLRALGRRMVVHAQVTHCEPGARLEFRSTVAPLQASGFRAVSAERGGTCFTYGLQVELTGLYRLFAGPLARSYGRRIEQDLTRLKALLEVPRLLLPHERGLMPHLRRPLEGER